MRPRLGNDADEDGQKYHPRDVVADKCFNVKVVKPDLDDEQCAESPKEDAQEMLANDVLPKMLLDDMLACRGDEPHHNQAYDGKNQVHPRFVEDIELCMSDFFVFMFQNF